MLRCSVESEYAHLLTKVSTVIQQKFALQPVSLWCDLGASVHMLFIGLPREVLGSPQLSFGRYLFFKCRLESELIPSV